MVDRKDYYTILGVPRDAPEAEIRRAFRARAKILHPDGKPAEEREEAQAEFTLLNEAYETLKDADRRAAYDEDLYFSQQLAAAGGKRGRARRDLVRGFAAGALVTVLALGAAKIYADRAGLWTAAPKSQDSLRAQNEDRIEVGSAAETEHAKSSQPNFPEAATDGGTPQDTMASPERVPAGEAPQSRIAPAPEDNAPQPQPPAAPSANTAAETMASPQPPSPAEALTAPGSAPAPLQRNPSATQPASPSPASPPRFALAKAVLSIEQAISAGGGDVEAYRLVSLVNSSNSIGALSEAGLLARRPESRELIASRIAALKNEQSKPPAPASAERTTPPQEPASGADTRLNDGGKIEIAAGPPGAEISLRLSPGRGLTESFSDCSNCPELVVIPGGQSVIGSRPENAGFRPEEAPAHRISIRKPFAVSKRWISAENWRACVDDGVCRPTLSSVLSAGPGLPATRVSWFDAKDYVEWLSRITGHRYRLLSEAEWEYAAQAGAAREAGSEAKADNPPPGPLTDFGLSRLNGGAKRWMAARPNAWGLLGLSGSVLEWVEDCWHPAYTQAPSDGSAWLQGAGGDCAYRVVRGTDLARGDPGRRRFTARAREFADASSPALGFRVAREIPLPARTALGTLPAGTGKTSPAD